MKRGDIYIMEMHNQNGSVQMGYRPVIIVQNDTGNHFSPTTIVCGITSAKKKKLPTHIDIGTSGGLKKKSIVLCEQIQTINKFDLKFQLGSINDQKILTQLKQGLIISLGM